jgi:hypothetical protein
MNSLSLGPLLLGFFTAALAAQNISLHLANSSHLNLETIRGGALSTDGKRLFTWGDSLREWTLPGLRSRILSKAKYNEGGCLMDVDQDGEMDLILQEGIQPGNLVWLHSPDWKSRTIDTGAELHDCLPTTLLGHRGFLMIQRYSQVRFYEPPATLDAHWPMQEVYSFYTPSRQTGLLRADIDGDGLIDILAGNDWIKSPDRFDLPWHLFAINTYNEVADSAMLQIALTEPANGLAMSQGHMENARVTWFEKSDDPRRLWIGHRLSDGLNLVNPHALAVFDFDEDGKPDIVAAEHNGKSSRLFVFLQQEERGSFRPVELPFRTDAIAIFPRAPGEFISIGADNVTISRYTVRK